MTARQARQDARDISVRDTEFGPDIVYDYGVQGTVTGLTDADLARTAAVLNAHLAGDRTPAAVHRTASGAPCALDHPHPLGGCTASSRASRSTWRTTRSGALGARSSPGNRS